MTQKNILSFVIVLIFVAILIFLQPHLNPLLDTSPSVPLLEGEGRFIGEEELSPFPFQGKAGDEVRFVTIAGQNIKAEVVVTPEAQARGLSARQGLAENEGMLFVFEYPDKYFFWMKDMKFAIDIIWIGEDMKIIYIKKDARPELYPETYGPEADAKYVLEVVSGFSDKHNLKEGDMAEFSF